MLRIVKKNELYLVGKMSDLLEVLDDYCEQYTTVKSLIDDHLSNQEQYELPHPL